MSIITEDAPATPAMPVEAFTQRKAVCVVLLMMQDSSLGSKLTSGVSC